MACRRTRAISARFRGGRATRRMHMNLLLWKWTRLRTRPTRMVVLPAAVAAVAAAIAALCAAAILAAHPGCWTLLRSAPAILPRELSTMMVLTPVLTWCVLLSTRGPFTMVPRVADATRPHHASRSYHAWHAHRAPAPLPGGRATRGLTPHAPPPPQAAAGSDNAGSDDAGDAGGGLGGLDDADGADLVRATVHAWPLHNGATRG